MRTFPPSQSMVGGRAGRAEAPILPDGVEVGAAAAAVEVAAAVAVAEAVPVPPRTLFHWRLLLDTA